MPVNTYLKFAELLGAVGGDAKETKETGSLIADAFESSEQTVTVEAADAVILAWSKLLEHAIALAELRGYDKARTELTVVRKQTEEAKASPAASPFTPAEMELVKAWKSAKGQKMPEVIRRFITWRFTKGASMTEMAKRFNTSYTTLRPLMDEAVKMVEQARASIDRAQAKDGVKPKQAPPASAEAAVTSAPVVSAPVASAPVAATGTGGATAAVEVRPHQPMPSRFVRPAGGGQ